MIMLVLKPINSLSLTVGVSVEVRGLREVCRALAEGVRARGWSIGWEGGEDLLTRRGGGGSTGRPLSTPRVWEGQWSAGSELGGDRGGGAVKGGRGGGGR